MIVKKLRLQIILATFFLFSMHFIRGQNNILIDANGNLNNHADQVGIWINTVQDRNTANYRSRLQELNVSSIRYGWGYGVFDKNNTATLEQSPCDDQAQRYLSISPCRINEKFGPDGVANLLNQINVDGIAVLSLDGINYTGSQDSGLAALPIEQKSDFYEQRAADFARWAKSNRINSFEIGNESDWFKQLDKVSPPRATRFTGASYAHFAKQMAQAVKAANPNAKIGINGGGLNGSQADREWFDQIYAEEPNINDDIDYVITHKYENWLNYNIYGDINTSISYNLGRLGDGVRNSRATHFPNKPFYVTEIGGWNTQKPEQAQHYIAVLNCEVLGNVFMDDFVEKVWMWPTTWEPTQGVMDLSPSYNLRAYGNGMKAYTQFMEPRMVSVGFINAGVRYFASKDPVTNEMTVWLINRGTSSVSPNININNFAASSENEVWTLRSPGDSPSATTNTLKKVTPIQLNKSGSTASFSVSCSPISVTIVKFKAPTSNPAPPTTNLTEVAQGKSATQKTTLASAVASRAVDGNTNGKFSSGSVTHTMCGKQDWWRVDLGSNYNIEDIKLWNRTDGCCADRLSNYDVSVLDAGQNQVWSQYEPGVSGARTTVNTGGITGRFVEVKLRGRGCLSLAEVQVFANVASSSLLANISDLESTTAAIVIYPNPVQQYFKAKGIKGTFSATIYNLQGEKTLHADGLTQEDQIDMSGMSPGIYLVGINSEIDGTSVIKIVKE